MEWWSTTDKSVLASLNQRGAIRDRANTHCTRGSTSNWWNGGGDDSVHSSVVAPAPHGLSAACSLRTKASITPQMKISTPKPEMKEPTEDTRFQPAKASG